jgi:hypothetical protein
VHIDRDYLSIDSKDSKEMIKNFSRRIRIIRKIGRIHDTIANIQKGVNGSRDDIGKKLKTF